MLCRECGQEVPAESVFCPQCGGRLDVGNVEKAPAGQAPRAAGAAELTAARDRARGKHPPEEDLWAGTYSPKAMVGPAIVVAGLTLLGFVAAALTGPVGWMALVIGAVLLWGGLLLLLWYRQFTVRYRLTTYRFFHEMGLFHRLRDRIEVIDIKDVTLRQSLLERLFDVGTIHILSSDSTHPELDLPGIENVRHVADLIDDTRRAERMRRGLFMV